MTGIYKITSPKGKVYIGQSTDIHSRFLRYKRLDCAGQRYLHGSLCKYGSDNHTFDVIHQLPEDVDREILNNYEILYWELYKSLGVITMNLKEPGISGRHTPEIKLMMSIRRKGIKNPKKANIGEKNGMFGRLGDKNPNYGKIGSLHKQSKKVFQIDINTNEVITVFNSIRQAEKILGIDRSSIIRTCKGVQNKAGDYKWEYVK